MGVRNSDDAFLSHTSFDFELIGQVPFQRDDTAEWASDQTDYLKKNAEDVN